MIHQIAVLATLVLLAPAPAAPAISLTPAAPTVGSRATVSLTGWPAGNASVEICRDTAPLTSTSCAYADAAQTVVRPDGTGRVALAVVAPPGGCPCVVRVRAMADGTTRTAPVTLAGAPTTPVEAAAPPGRLTVTRVGVSGGPAWSSAFGGPAHRVVEVVVRNSGATPLSGVLTVTVGRGDNPSTIVEAPPLDPVAPSSERVVTVPVTLAGPAVGTYTIRGDVTGGSEPVAFAVETTTQPWGLTALLAALLLTVTVLMRRQLFARQHRPAML